MSDSKSNTTNEVVVAGAMMTVTSDSKTRPTNTTAYASGDVINESASAGTNLTFSNAVRIAGGSGIIAEAMIDDSANQSTTLEAELWLFDTNPTADNDNAVFTPSDAEMQTVVGVVPIASVYAGDATAGAVGNLLITSGQVNIPFKVADGSRDLFGVLVARNDYTPVSAEVFNIRLKIYQD